MVRNARKPISGNDAGAMVGPLTKSKRVRAIGTRCVWPGGVELMFDISPATRWRWERIRKLPPRDVFVGGKAIGWKPETLEAAQRGTAS